MASSDESLPKKRRKRRRLTEADMSLFLRQYGRKAHRGHDPNDRQYSRKIEQKIKRMRVEEVDRLIREEDAGSDSPRETEI
jgi:hypothetical protein